jgi:glutamyl/glutaminyl-tRNA synthetase
MNGSYTGTCYDRQEILFDKSFNIRIKTKTFTDNQFYFLGERKTLSPDLHDLIAWKKDQTPSYQILSLYQDHLIGTNCIIRGIDLLESSAIQIMLSKKLNLDFHNSYFHHHPLLKSLDGNKLSKSTNKADQKSLIDQYQRPKLFFEDLSERIKLKFSSTTDFIKSYPDLEDQKLEVSIH